MPFSPTDGIIPFNPPLGIPFCRYSPFSNSYFRPSVTKSRVPNQISDQVLLRHPNARRLYPTALMAHPILRFSLRYQDTEVGGGLAPLDTNYHDMNIGFWTISQLSGAFAATRCGPVNHTPQGGVEIRSLWPRRADGRLAPLGVSFTHQGEGISPLSAPGDVVLPILTSRVG